MGDFIIWARVKPLVIEPNSRLSRQTCGPTAAHRLTDAVLHWERCLAYYFGLEVLLKLSQRLLKGHVVCTKWTRTTLLTQPSLLQYQSFRNARWSLNFKPFNQNKIYLRFMGRSEEETTGLMYQLTTGSHFFFLPDSRFCCPCLKAVSEKQKSSQGKQTDNPALALSLTDSD